MKRVDAVLVGAGSRGFDPYGAYALDHPDEFRYIAVVEPVKERHENFARIHRLDPKYVFASADELYALGQMAPALVNTTGDIQHLETTVPALQLGYHVMLEKPMAVTPHGCVRIVALAEEKKRVLQIGHGMRYAPFFAAVRDIIASGKIGQVMSIDHRENVFYWHMAHSFVRGKWGNLARSSPMILSKSCHDTDMLRWVVGKPCLRIVSFGSLTHFRPDAVGPEIPARCTDGCPIAEQCPYNAMHFYLGKKWGWPPTDMAIGQPDPGEEGRLELLRTGPFGRCVYRCDNDVVDHQVAILEFEGGTTATFTMEGFSTCGGRTLRYDGTRGSLVAREIPDGTVYPDGNIMLYQHLGDTFERVDYQKVEGGHGGGDTLMLRTFVKAVQEDDPNVLSSARTSLEGHLLAFAAEESRLNGTIIDMPQYIKRIERETAAMVAAGIKMQ